MSSEIQIGGKSMDEFLTSLLVIGTEFGILVGIILLVVLFMFLKKRMKDKRIAQQFTNDFKEFSSDRKVNLEHVIDDAFNLGNAATKEYAEIIMKNERKICSNMLSLFNGSDRDLLLQLQGDLENLTDAYKALASMSNSKEQDASGGKDDEGLLEKTRMLADENERLKDDLKKALESVDYLQTQYTELFKKTNKDDD